MAVTARVDEMKWMKERKKKKKHTHEREFNQETVLHDWCHGKELYTTRDPNEGIIKKLRTAIGPKFIGMCTYEHGSGSNTDSPDSERACPGLSELPRKKKCYFMSVESGARGRATYPREERGGRGL